MPAHSPDSLPDKQRRGAMHLADLVEEYINRSGNMVSEADLRNAIAAVRFADEPAPLPSLGTPNNDAFRKLEEAYRSGCSKCRGDSWTCKTVVEVCPAREARKALSHTATPSHYEQQAAELEEMEQREIALSLRAKNAMKAAAHDLRELSKALSAIEPLKQVVRELLETAGDDRNSDDYIGKVFRARRDELKVATDEGAKVG